MKKFLALVLLVSCLHPQIICGLVPEKSTVVQNAAISDTIVRDVEHDDCGVTVKYHIPMTLVRESKESGGGTVLSVSGFGHEIFAGNIPLPAHTDRIQIPSYVDSVNIELLSCSYRDEKKKLSSIVLPSYMASKTRLMNFEKNREKEILLNYRIGVKRRAKFADVTICPIVYNDKDEVVRIYDDFVYRVNYVGVKEQLCSDSLDDCLKTSRQKQSTTNGWISLRDFTGISTSVTLEHYIIVTVSKYKEAVEKLKEFKKRQGYKVYTVYADGKTNHDIWNQLHTIYSYYYGGYGKLDTNYILIVGNISDVPSYSLYSQVDNTSYVSDVHYSCLDNMLDFDPDAYIGRLPVSNLAEANVVIDKIIKYENTPIENSNFYSTAVHSSSFNVELPNDSTEDMRFTKDSELIRDYLKPKGFDIKRVYKASASANPMRWSSGIHGNNERIPEELMKPKFSWNGSKQDVIAAINSGCNYILFSGHGVESGLLSPQFHIPDVEKLNNRDMLPVAFILGCSSGNFSTSCLASSLLTKEGGGCVAVFSNTEKSYSPNQSPMVHAMFNTIWPSPGFYPSINIAFNPQIPDEEPLPRFTLGKMLENGIERMEELYSGNVFLPYTKLCKDRIHILGDPSMYMHSKSPSVYNDNDIRITSSMVNPITQKLFVDIVVYTGDDNTCLAYSSAKSYVASRKYYGRRIEFADSISATDRFYLYGPNKIPQELYFVIMSPPPVLAKAYKYGQSDTNIQISRDADVTVNKVEVILTNVIDGSRKAYEWLPEDENFIIDTQSLTEGQYLVGLYENGVQLKYWNIMINR
ncbi:MAG: hypothetical protein K2I56_05250 [Muribaculaceae bacterium]|nr:hypothetical protein [Muribaculaceae bacterium]